MLRPDAERNRLRHSALFAKRLLLLFRQMHTRSSKGDKVALIVLVQARIKEVHLGRADEARHEKVGRMVEHLLRRPDLLDKAVFHDDDAVPKRHGFGLVMGNIDESRVNALAEFDDFGAHLVPELCIQIGKRLIHQEHLRVTHNGAPDRNALPLAARKRFRLAIQILGDIQNFCRLAHFFVDDFLFFLAQLKRERHVFINRHVRIKCVILEHHRDVAVLWRNIIYQLIANVKFAAADFLKAGHHAQRRRLSAARRTHKHNELLVRNLQVELLHRDHIFVVDLLDVFERYLCHVPGSGGKASASFASRAQAGCAAHYGRSPHCRTASRAVKNTSFFSYRPACCGVRSSRVLSMGLFPNCSTILFLL